MTSVFAIYREQKELADTERIAHRGNECARDVEGAFCEHCQHLRDRVHDFYSSWPGWLLVLYGLKSLLTDPILTVKTFREAWRKQRGI